MSRSDLQSAVLETDDIAKNPTIAGIWRGLKGLALDSRVLASLPGGGGKFDDQTVAKAAAGSKNAANGLRLARAAQTAPGGSILELGTNVGVSTAYLAVGAGAHPGAHIITLECSGARISVAKALHQSLSLSNIEYVEGYFSDTLPQVLERPEVFDLCFIDGDHTYQATLDYYDAIVPRMSRRSTMILDDIDWSDEMRTAWRELHERTAGAEAFALDGMGYVTLP